MDRFPQFPPPDSDPGDLEHNAKLFVLTWILIGSVGWVIGLITIGYWIGRPGSPMADWIVGFMGGIVIGAFLVALQYRPTTD